MELIIKKGENKSLRPFIPLGIYLIMATISAFLGINPKASFMGNYVSLQGVIVLLGYGIIAFYTYQIMDKKRDYTTIYTAIKISFLVISVIGWLQVLSIDIMKMEPVQKLLMNSEDYASYGGEVYNAFNGNNVFLTLFNPNYAAMYLVMMAAVFTSYLILSENKAKRIEAGILLLDALILTWFTYTRAALVAVVVLGIMAIILMYKCKDNRPINKKILITVVSICVVIVLGLVAVDINVFDARFIGRLVDKDNGKLTDLRVNDDKILITYNDIDNTTHTTHLGIDNRSVIYKESTNYLYVKELDKSLSNITLTSTIRGDITGENKNNIYFKITAQNIFIDKDYSIIIPIDNDPPNIVPIIVPIIL